MFGGSCPKVREEDADRPNVTDAELEDAGRDARLPSPNVSGRIQQKLYVALSMMVA